MMRRVHVLFAAPIIAALALAACGDDPDPGSGDSLGVEGPQWVLTDVGPDADAGVAMSTLKLEGGTASGSAGCNSFSGTYTLDGDSLSFGPLASTQMACIPDEVGDLETAVLAGLDATEAYEVDGETLTLKDGDGETVLTYTVATEQGLEGSWDVIGYLDADKSGFVSVVVDSEPSLEFADGTVTGTTGCNQLNGPYTVDGDTVDIGPLATTKMACPDDLSAQEAGILAALDAAVTWTATPNGAELYDAEDMRVLQMAPAS